ncbi:serine/threonine-protein kinase [Mycobacterium spongiae]|uniref:non-specific serine/threonine protein kinase n=1 Tax=Mycobacterium spongiae TaxID=886343 RepID=A0A975JXX0_9MYCO|nr:serine/threonine-protein kinase [Mycobacterium spongiae]QUR67413.1 protein kinase [Mycobacterium spongiae]
MDEHQGNTRRFGARRRLGKNTHNPSTPDNPRPTRQALRARFHRRHSPTITQSGQPRAAERHGEAAASCPLISNGAAFAGYTILRRLGVGGMAEVYLALHPRLPRRDVIKVLAEALNGDGEFRERFNREADLAAPLWHPHIVGVHDRGEFNGRLWLSMDYVEGTDAARLVNERHQDGVPIHEVCAIVHAVASALDYAHAGGLLHRDVKPANILLTYPEAQEHRILLADFGLARHLGNVIGVTKTNVAVGTVAYAAPEQLMGSSIDGRADQYALAATVFHLLTGVPPFRDSNPVAVVGQHLNADPPRISGLRPDLAHLDEVFFKALAKQPDERFERCRAFAAAIAGELDAAVVLSRSTQSCAVVERPRSTGPLGAIAAMSVRCSSGTRWATALVCAVLTAVSLTWSVVYSVRPDGPQSNREPAASPQAPDPGAAPTISGPALNGTYKLDYDKTNLTADGVSVRRGGPSSNWWAFRSVCTTNGCAATGTLLDDAVHRVASSKDGGQVDTLRFVGGYWQGAPQRERVRCRQPNADVRVTQQEMVAWSLAPQADGTLLGTQIETIVSNECGAQGAVVRVPVVATRVGGVPAGVTLADPTGLANATNPPSTSPSPPVLGAFCSDVDRVAYGPTTSEQIVCEGNTWARAPVTVGVHTSGSSCDRPGTSVFAMSTSDDGYLLQCDPVTRTWTRPAG